MKGRLMEDIICHPHQGHKQLTMTMESANSSGFFQNWMETLLYYFMWKFTRAYIDSIITYNRTPTDYIIHMDKRSTLLERAGYPSLSCQMPLQPQVTGNAYSKACCHHGSCHEHVNNSASPDSSTMSSSNLTKGKGISYTNAKIKFELERHNIFVFRMLPPG